MNQLRRARQAVSEMIEKYLDTAQRMARLMEDSEKAS
jgi:hypothetical protein